MITTRTRAAAAALVAAALSTAALAEKGGAPSRGEDGGVAGGLGGVEPLTTYRIAAGFVRPLHVVSPPGDYNRLFVVEKVGVIKILNLHTETVNATAFLNIDALVGPGVTNSLNGEQGLLGLAFDPDYFTNGFFYVLYTNSTGTAEVLARYTVQGDPNTSDVANPGSAVIMKTISTLESNHNGGTLQFGLDGMLYLSTGDGGGANDQHGTTGNGQNTGTLLGKMLRLDPDNPPTYVAAGNPFVGPGNPLDEIWHSGLRNPWKFSFDSLTGDMYIGDVGQNAREEIDFAANGVSGLNYGWRCMEGTACTGLSGCTCNSPSLTLPIFNYVQGSSTGFCVTGGHVYRGCDIPSLQGHYIYGDFVTSRIFSFKYDGTMIVPGTQVQRTTELDPPGTMTIASVASFGQDARGELYIVEQGNPGEIFKIIPVTPTISPADLDCNGIVDGADLGMLLLEWGSTNSPANFDGMGGVDGADLGTLLIEFD
jgi:hypothetical protein